MLFILAARGRSHVSTRHSGVNVKSSLFPSYRMIYSSDLSCSTCVSHGQSSTSDMTAAPMPWESFVQGPEGSEIIFEHTISQVCWPGHAYQLLYKLNLKGSVCCLTSRKLKLKYHQLESCHPINHPSTNTGRIRAPATDTENRQWSVILSQESLDVSWGYKSVRAIKVSSKG